MSRMGTLLSIAACLLTRAVLGSAPDLKAARTDRSGNPLPPGAVARLGSLRFRQGSLILSIAYAPDGKLLAVGDWRGSVYLWDVATGKIVRRMEAALWCHFGFPPFRPEGKLAFSPDGKLLALDGAADRIHNGAARGILLCDTKSGKVIRRLSRTPSNTFAFSPDGKVLAVAEEKRVCLLDSFSGKERATLDPGETSVRGLTFAKDGKSLVMVLSSFGAQNLCVWDLRANKEIRRFPIGLRGFALSPDGMLLASRGDDNRSIQILDVVSSKERRQFRFRDDEGSDHFAFSPDGKNLACVGRSWKRKEVYFVRSWDVASGKPSWRVEGSQYLCSDLAYAPDGKTVAVAWVQVQLLDAATGKDLFPPRENFPDVSTIALSPDGRMAATSARDDGVIRLWELPACKEGQRLQGHKNKIWQILFSPDGKRLLSRDWDHSVRLWDVKTGRESMRCALKTEPLWVGFCEDGTVRMVQPDQDEEGIVIDTLPPGKEPLKLALPVPRNARPDKRLHSLTLSPDTRAVVKVTGDGTVGLWSTANGKLLHRIDGSIRRAPREEKGGEVAGPMFSPNIPVAFSPDGRTLANHNDRWGLRLWEVATGRERCRLRGAPSDTCALAFSPDGLRVMSGDQRGGLRLWDAVTGAELWQGEGHLGIIMKLVFSADGRWLVSAGNEYTALLWDVRQLAPAAPSTPRRLAEKERSRLWADLADADAGKAYQAVHALRRAEPAVIAWMGEQLRTGQTSATPEQIVHLIDDLDSNQFPVRQDASRKLEKLGVHTEAHLRRRLQQRASPELRRRAGALLSKLERCAVEPDADELRALRTLEVLEGAGTAEARRTLEMLARVLSGPRSLPEARLTLQRLSKRLVSR